MNLAEPISPIAHLFELLAEKEAVIFKSAPINNDYFSESLFSSAKQKFSRDGYLYAITSMKKYYSALEALRAKNQNLYHVLINQAIAAEEPGRLLENKLIASCSSAIIAYEKYTRSAFGEATALLERSFKIDTELEDNGFEILHFHKIQLMHNYARIYLKTDKALAINLLLDLVALTGKNIDFKYAAFTISHDKNAISPSVNKLMFIQVCNELLVNYLKILADDDLDLLNKSLQPFFSILRDLPPGNEHSTLFARLLENILAVNNSDTFIKSANQIIDFMLLADDTLLYHKVLLLTAYHKVSLKFNYADGSRFNTTIQTLFSKYVYLNKSLFDQALRSISTAQSTCMVLSHI